MKEIETLDDYKHSRMLESMNFEAQSYEPMFFQNIQINYPKENCKQLISLFFEEHKMSFDQFCQFDTITDLNLLKRELSDYSERLEIEDEDNFTRFFIENLPLEDNQRNDSIFSIFAKIVSQYYQNLNEICQIIQECVPRLSNPYYIDIFTAICNNHPFNHQWEILIEKYIEDEIQMNDFLKASSGLIKNHIYPPSQEDFIMLLISKPITGIFKVLKILNLTREEIQTFEIDFLLTVALKEIDSKLTADALDFISEASNVFLLQNPIITELIFSLLERGNYKQKIKVIVFFDTILTRIPIEFIAMLIENNILEKVGDMLYGSSLEVQFCSLRIIRYCIDIQKSNLLGTEIDVIERCHKPEIYDTVSELKNSTNKNISVGAIDVINELDNITNNPMFP